MLERIAKKYFPPHWHGIAFDVIFILLNFTLLPFMGSKIQSLLDDSFQNDEQSFLIIAIIFSLVYIWRLISLVIKKIPVRQRAFIATEFNSKDGFDTPFYLWILSLFTAMLSFAFILVLVLTVLEKAGIGKFSDYENSIGFVGIAVAVFEMALIFRLLKKPGKEELKKLKNNAPIELKKSIRTHYSKKEIFADLGLFAYMFIWQAFYNLYLAVIVPNAFRSVTVFISVFIVSMVVFVMFYLGARVVFLIEDASYKTTWVSISLVFLASFASHLFYGFIGFLNLI